MRPWLPDFAGYAAADKARMATDSADVSVILTAHQASLAADRHFKTAHSLS